VLQTGWYYCDGSTKNRVTDVNLFNAITIQQSGALTSGSAVVTGLSDTSNLSPGMPMSGTGVQAAAVIQSIDSATQITMSLTASAPSTTSLVFAPYGVGDGSTTFGVPNRAYIAVGRDNASGSASNVMQVSTNLSTTSGSATATVGSAAGLFIGMYISHPKVPNGTKINNIVGTTITMSNNASAPASSTGRFSPILDAQTLGTVGGAVGNALITAQVPAHTHSGTTGAMSANASHTHGITVANGSRVVTATGGGASNFAGGSFQDVTLASQLTINSTNTDHTHAFTTDTGTGGGTAHNNAQPTIVMNIIIKR
jgi:microcystin-dependent protein